MPLPRTLIATGSPYRHVTPLEWGSGSLGPSRQLLDAAENSKVCHIVDLVNILTSCQNYDSL